MIAVSVIIYSLIFPGRLKTLPSNMLKENAFTERMEASEF